MVQKYSVLNDLGYRLRTVLSFLEFAIAGWSKSVANTGSNRGARLK